MLQIICSIPGRGLSGCGLNLFLCCAYIVARAGRVGQTCAVCSLIIVSEPRARPVGLLMTDGSRLQIDHPDELICECCRRCAGVIIEPYLQPRIVQFCNRTNREKARKKISREACGICTEPP
jgi:hypothetical protein